MDTPTVKPFKENDELVELLITRGMEVEDKERAKRKLEQVGYYRLSGYSYPWRDQQPNVSRPHTATNRGAKKHVKSDNFVKGTTFNKVFQLYLLDKKLRVLFFDAIERIEIYLRTIIAHEMGRHSPLAYQDESYINPKFRSQNNNSWQIWENKHQQLIDDSRLECITWYKAQYQNAIPIWVVIEAWDFGVLSKYFSMLKGTDQNNICKRISPSIKPHILTNWLIELNILRNRCAHHTRIWNENTKNDIKFPNDAKFQNIKWSKNSKSRLFALILITWYLMRILGKSSTWIDDMANCIDAKLPSLPKCDKRIMGFPSGTLAAIEQLCPDRTQ